MLALSGTHVYDMVACMVAIGESLVFYPLAWKGGGVALVDSGLGPPAATHTEVSVVANNLLDAFFGLC